MSWQLASFAVLALALAGGFAWYERVNPDARIVALVGTLAAFGALGRIAFAAVPNVKPTTDIVLISGYALGGGPGFAVGALAGLSSNFFFGQGPWTPWQMAAWGATGILGAALAWTTSPRVRARLRWRGERTTSAGQPWIGRWPLALVCCAAGFAFTVVQDFGDWVTYSDHSAAQLGVYVGKGLGFDAIHAAGCLLFALALGPALMRSIQRFARRLQVRWLPTGAIVPAVAVAVAGSVALGGHARASAAATAGPVSYLLGAEDADGGFGAAPGQASNPLYTGWAALGLASAGNDLGRVDHGRLIANIRASSASLSDVGSLERTILVVRAAGLSARRFGGRDLVATLEREVGANGSVSGQVNLTSFAILALRSAGVRVAPRTLAWLASQPDQDGGFSFAGAGATSDVDDTGAALEALAGDRAAAAGGVRRRAVAYLRRQQNRDGGFPSQPRGESNAQSTAWAIQGLEAAGIDVAGLHRAGSVSPLSYLRALVAPNGSVSYSRGISQTPVWVTGEALMALNNKPLPLAAPRVAAQRRVHRVRPASRHHETAAGAGTARRAPRLPRRAAAHRARRRAQVSSSVSIWVGWLASGAGVATAVALAPVSSG